MSRKLSGYILVGLGILLIVVSLLADSLGLGGVPGFGWKQVVGVVVGVIVAAAGLWWMTRRSA